METAVVANVPMIVTIPIIVPASVLAIVTVTVPATVRLSLAEAQEPAVNGRHRKDSCKRVKRCPLPRQKVAVAVRSLVTRPAPPNSMRPRLRWSIRHVNAGASCSILQKDLRKARSLPNLSCPLRQSPKKAERRVALAVPCERAIDYEPKLSHQLLPRA